MNIQKELYIELTGKKYDTSYYAIIGIMTLSTTKYIFFYDKNDMMTALFNGFLNTFRKY